ncbi:MAG: GNAT family N-acetyltransferase [Burkholderiaceae bacterium]|nr:GNAT family N-acetyltransferase [Burkholderiaceae bacterium]
MANFHIEAARPEDCGVILQFIRDLAEYERLLDQVVATEEDVRRELFGEKSVIRAVVAWEDETPVGFALYFFNFSTFLTRRGLYLEDLYVTPKSRGKGYGKQLMRHLAKTAKEEGCGRFEWSVLDWNEPAIGFYESLGATLMLDWRICRLTGEALDRFAGTEGCK